MYIHTKIQSIIESLPKDSEDLLDIYTDYLVGTGQLFNKQSKVCQHLLRKYLEDKSTKTICEEVSIKLLGAEHSKTKHGADGYDVERQKYIEVKPMYGDKLKGGNPFNDLTIPNVHKKIDWDICVSGFSESRLIFLTRFPFTHLAPWAFQKIEEVAEINRNKKEGESTSRCSPNFGYKQWIECPDLEIYYLDQAAAKHMSKPMYDALLARIK